MKNLKMLPSFLLATLYFSSILDANYIEQTVCCPPSCPSPDFFVEASFLYGQAQMDNLQFSQHARNSALVGGGIESNGELGQLDFAWDPGVQIELGWSYTDDWTCSLLGTFFQSHSTGIDISGSDPNTESLAPVWFPTFTGFVVGSASAKWDLELGMLDALIEKPLFLGSHFILIPHLGARGVWLDSKYHVDYEPASFILDPGFVTVIIPNTNLTFRSSYRAGGIKGGTKFEIPLLRQLALKGSIGASLVYGAQTLTQTIHGANPAVPPTTPASVIPFQSSLNLINNRLSANLESEIGFSFIPNFTFFNMELGCSYFFSMWFDQNPFRNQFFSSPVFNGSTPINQGITDKKYANLELQGLIFRATTQF